MNPTVKKKWLMALRSGEYAQGVARLRADIWNIDRPVYCCLGVLADLYLKEKGRGWDGQIRPTDGFLTEEVSEWAQLPDYLPELGDGGRGVQGYLVSMNDDIRANFATIADFIEENL